MSNVTSSIVLLETTTLQRSTPPAADGFDVLLWTVTAGARTEGVSETGATDESVNGEDAREEKAGEIALGNLVGFMPLNPAEWGAIPTEGAATAEIQQRPLAENFTVESALLEEGQRPGVEPPTVKADPPADAHREELTSVISVVENLPRQEREVEAEPMSDRLEIGFAEAESMGRRQSRPVPKDAINVASDKSGATPDVRTEQPMASAPSDPARSVQPSSHASGRGEDAETRSETIWIESNPRIAGRSDAGFSVPAPAGVGVELSATDGKAPVAEPARSASSSGSIDWLGLAKRIGWRWKDGDGEVSLDLHPRELGRVMVRLEASRDVVNVRLEVNNDAARAGLTQHVDDLSRALRDLGWKVDGVRVDLAGTGGSAADGRGRGGSRDGADSPFRNGGEPSEHRAITYAAFGPRHRVDLVA